MSWHHTIVAGVCGGMMSMAALAQDARPQYQAIQTISTPPNPFVSQIFVAPDKERQDAMLGGQVVSTIIRHDQGVAWLLIPSKKMYQVIDIQAVKSASVQALWQDQPKTRIGTAVLDGVTTTQYALNTSDGQVLVWVADDIVVKVEWPASAALGRPHTTMVLQQIQQGVQDPQRFELPADYTPYRVPD